MFRVGKKYTPVRVRYLPIRVTQKVGEFEPTCPIAAVDLPSETEILHGSIITVPPAPILVASRLKGPYLEGVDEQGYVHRIPVPDVERFKVSWGAEAS